MTVVVIAHRLSTIRDADKIVVVKDGVKVEEGNHNKLLEEHPSGIYARLVELDAATQTNEEEDDAELEDSPQPTLAKKSSVRRAGSMNVSQAETRKLD